MTRLQDIAARRNATTEGDWTAVEHRVGPRGLREFRIGVDGFTVAVVVGQRGNAEFIVHARQDTDVLLAAAKALHKRHQPLTIGATTTCTHCRDLRGALVTWPCPDAQILTPLTGLTGGHQGGDR